MCFRMSKGLPAVEEKPKKPMNEYQKFVRENHPIVRRDNPGVQPSVWLKIIAQLWNLHKKK